MAEVEIYTPTGVVAGETTGTPLSNDGPDLASPLTVDDSRWYPLDGGAPSQRGRVRIAPDDILLIVTGEEDITVHMNLYPITLDVGPYRVSAIIATLPGFDPDRALARPGHTYIPLRDATIELPSRGDVDPARRAHLHVNRYAVETVASNLMLGFFFPGAHFTEQEAVPVA
jgi:hypothetical protein